MGILKVVSVWYGCWYECGLIIWGFNHLDNCFDICFVSSFVAFYWVCLNLGLFYINSLNCSKSYFLCILYHFIIDTFGLI